MSAISRPPKAGSAAPSSTGSSTGGSTTGSTTGSIPSSLPNSITPPHPDATHEPELPLIEHYSDEELSLANWPAIQRYLELRKRTPQSFSEELRLRRHEAWLKCALATALDRAPASDICLFWSKQAERLILDAWDKSGLAKSRFCLIALGKLGANELNLSSDVDLVIVRDDTTTPDPQALREFQSLLSEVTAFGFCLRVDFTLRPGGRSASATPSESEFQYHYGYHGEMWERLAYVRMRVLAGPDDLADSIRKFARKFSFRKHLDFTLLDELKSLRAKIRLEKYETRPGFFHLKVGEGGIRDIELFVHALQVIHGGRNLNLQTHNTSSALTEIQRAGILPHEDCDFLLKSYWYLRSIENRIHAWEDQQTYLIETRYAHPAVPSELTSQINTICPKVAALVTSLLGDKRENSQTTEDLARQDDWLKESGFSDHSRTQVWPDLLAATALSRRSELDERERLVFLHDFVAKLSEIGLDRDLGLSLLLDFVRSTRAKASFFTLLNREPRVRNELAALFSISPYLGSILCSRPELIDAFILRRQAEPTNDFNQVLEELTERRLLAELIGASQFLSDHDLGKLSRNLSENADSICQILLTRLNAEYAETDDSENSIGLVAMGKWGGLELGLKSDLDFIFVSRREPTASEQKIAKRFLSRITEPHRGGSIYSVDMRLRPSGQSGPILVFQDDLLKYLRETAAPWERQAHLRSRPLLHLSYHPAQVASERGLSSTDRAELVDIRRRLFCQVQAAELDLKLTYGGLADVEYCAQVALLQRKEIAPDGSTSGMIRYLESIDATWKDVGPEIRRHYDFLRSIEQLFQLTTSRSGSKVRVKSEEFKRLALIKRMKHDELSHTIQSTFARVTQLLKEVDTLAQ